MNTTDHFKNTFQQALWQVLTERKSLRFKREFGKLLLQRKNSGSYETIFTGKSDRKKISISDTRWPSFSAFGFTAGGIITLEIEDYSTKVVVNPNRRIRQTKIVKNKIR